jgi:hypothetical protein
MDGRFSTLFQVADQYYDWRETCFDKWQKLKVEELLN